MIVNYFGNGSFKLQSGQTSLLVDPESNRFKADVTLRTLVPADLSASTGSEEADASDVSFPGEYEIKGITIRGVAVPEESTEKFLKTIYFVNWEDAKLAFLGHISRPLSAAALAEFEEPDVLFLPVGGGRFLGPEEAAKLAKQMEPSFIVPSFCLPAGQEGKGLADFLRAMGQKAEPEEKLVFKKKDLEEAKNKVVVLKP